LQRIRNNHRINLIINSNYSNNNNIALWNIKKQYKSRIISSKRKWAVLRMLSRRLQVSRGLRHRRRRRVVVVVVVAVAAVAAVR